MVKHKILQMKTDAGKVTVVNIKNDVLDFVKESGIKNGTVNVQSMHTTCSVLFEEMVHDTDYKGDDFLMVDLVHGLSKIFPKQESENTTYRYPGPEHTEFGIKMDKDVAKDLSLLLNADAHLRSDIIGASETFAIIDGEVQTGPWGYIYFIDWDGCRQRERKCVLTAMGE